MKMNIKESKYWADQLARKIIELRGNKKHYVLEGGVGPSARKHIGSIREFMTIDFVRRALQDLGKDVTFQYSWDAFDRLKKISLSIPENKRKPLEKYIGSPVGMVPDPFGCHKSYAEHFEGYLEDEVKQFGIKNNWQYQDKLFTKCVYWKGIRAAMQDRWKIIKILNKYREHKLAPDWWPIRAYCEKCLNGDRTKITDYDGDTEIKYTCACGYSGEMDFSKVGMVKPTWRVDWAMRWDHYDVDFEPSGKDHMVAGSSYDTCKEMIQEVYGKKPPFGIMYEFVGKKGLQKKMSASSGDIVTATEVLSIYPPQIVRWFFAGTKPLRPFVFPFDEEVFKVYDDFYECEKIYFGKKKVNDREQAHWSRVYEMSAVDKLPKKMPIQPAFKHCVGLINVYQTPEKALASVLASQKLTKVDQSRYLMMLERARTWIDKYAPDQYRFELQIAPSSAGLSANQVAALADLVKILKGKKELATAFGGIAKAHDLGMKDFFSAVYQVLVGKERGPRLAQFIEAVGRRKIAKIIDVGLKNTKKIATSKTSSESSGYKPINGTFEIQKDVVEKFPGLKCGVAVIRGVKVQKSIPELEKLKKETVKQMIKEFKDVDLKDVPVLKEYRRIYKATGVDPTKKKPSPLALLTRVKKGQELYTVNTLVDVYNLAVMKTQVSMGAFDLKNLNFPTYLRFAKEGEQFTPLMSDKASSVRKGELIYADKKGLVFCRDLNYRDSDFTKITDKTRDTILYVDGTIVTSEEELKTATELAVKWILKYCGGKLESINYTF
jgi:lysyl-tRNA synthetase, class I